MKGQCVRIAITGVRGRVGRPLAKSLIEDGHSVVGVDLALRGESSTEDLIELQLGLDDSTALAEAFDGSDVVIHLAALMSWREEDSSKLFDANVVGTFSVLRAAVAAHVRRFVFASTGDVYPEVHTTDIPYDEESPRNPTSTYGMTKLVGEEMVKFFGRHYPLETVVLRFSHTQDAAELLDESGFFSGPRFFLRPRLAQQRSFGNEAAAAALAAHDDDTAKLLIARGDDGSSFRMEICDTRDLVAGISLAVMHPNAAGETIAIGPDSATSMDEIVPIMARMTGLPVVEVNLPGPTIDYETSNRKARELLGFRPKWSTAAMLDEAFETWKAKQ